MDARSYSGLAAFLFLVSIFPTAAIAKGPAPSLSLCQNAVAAFNQQFNTTNGLDKNGDLPLDSGLIVHTIHGPDKTALDALNALPVDADKTCGAYLNMTPPVFLPWCGSNKDPRTQQWDDSSSWTYIRSDTLIDDRNLLRPDEVVCSDTGNKNYGLIFSNAYMNVSTNTLPNLGCMYPLDGDTGNRTQMGCGISQNPNIDRTYAQGACPSSETLKRYGADFSQLLNVDNGQEASYAGSLICSLSKPQFDLWIGARQTIDLSFTTWPVNEFVLFNWETYSTNDLANNKYLVGMYYLSGCSKASGGTRADAQAIADLYAKWSGVDLPVVNLSNQDMRVGGNAPFSCN